MTFIADDAFKDCTALLTVSFEAGGTGLATIGASAFDQSGLTTFELPNTVTSLGGSSFNGCADLTTFTFAAGSTLASIGTSAFYQSGLTTFDFFAIDCASAPTLGTDVFSSTAFSAIALQSDWPCPVALPQLSGYSCGAGYSHESSGTASVYSSMCIATSAVAGAAGSDGATGPTGAQGVQGETGATGATGAAGNDGNDGATGPAGPTGNTGTQGEKGEKGEKGGASLHPLVIVSVVLNLLTITYLVISHHKGDTKMDSGAGKVHPQGVVP
jgi:hypothetical protein